MKNKDNADVGEKRIEGTDSWKWDRAERWSIFLEYNRSIENNTSNHL